MFKPRLRDLKKAQNESQMIRDLARPSPPEMEANIEEVGTVIGKYRRLSIRELV